MISTPSGSTGHSLSIGGPVLHESLDVLIITPVAPVHTLKGDAAKGKNAYAVCAACHGADANGVEGLGVSLLVSELVARSDEDGIVAFLQVGRLPQAEDSITGVPMPAFSWMEPEQLDELAAYLKSLQQP